MPEEFDGIVGQPAAPVKVSPAQLAARALVMPPPVRPVSLAGPSRVLRAARLLWCRNQALPTVRAIAREANLAPSSVVGPFGSLGGLFAELIRREVDALEAVGFFDQAESSWIDRVADRVVALARADRSLARFPATVCSSVAGLPGSPSVSLTRVAVLHAFAAIADVGVLDVCDAVKALRVGLDSFVHEIAAGTAAPIAPSPLALDREPADQLG